MMTYENWIRDTDLGLFHPRRPPTVAVGQALKDYHQQNGNPASFEKLRMAFKEMLSAQAAHANGNWMNADRNRRGALTRLNNEIVQEENARAIRPPRKYKDQMARHRLLVAEAHPLESLFADRVLVFKNERWKTALADAVITGMALKEVATSIRELVTPDSISEVTKNILGGLDPHDLFQQLGTNFSNFTKAAGHILSAAVDPGKLLIHITAAAMMVNKRVVVNRERFMFRAGAANAALDCIIRLIDLDLKITGIEMAKDVTSIVAGAFQASPLAGAANAIVSILVNLRLYAMMAEEMREGNRLLGQGRYDLELFNASPVLGCYFLIMADTSLWINYSVLDIGAPHWMDTVEQMAKRAAPVREKARRLIRESRYALSGTEGFKGLQFEPTWRKNKWEFLKRFVNTRSDQLGGIDYVLNKVA
jgi:hypothetical protein